MSILGDLTLEHFAGRLNQTFYLTIEAIQLEMELVEAEGIVRPPRRGTPKGRVREQPFSIVFRGPNETPLGQGMYNMRHDEIGDFSGIFLVPIAADEQGRYYEAVFN